MAKFRGDWSKNHSQDGYCVLPVLGEVTIINSLSCIFGMPTKQYLDTQNLVGTKSCLTCCKGMIESNKVELEGKFNLRSLKAFYGELNAY